MDNEGGVRGAGGGGVLLLKSSANIMITSCTFQINSAANNIGVGGGGGAVLLSGTSGNVTMTNCTFQINSATNYHGGGGSGTVFVLVPIGYVIITNCTFQYNSVTTADYGGSGGAVLLNGLTWCQYHKLQNNNAVFGGAISIVSINSILISRSIFTKNTALGLQFRGNIRFINNAEKKEGPYACLTVSHCTSMKNV